MPLLLLIGFNYFFFRLSFIHNIESNIVLDHLITVLYHGIVADYRLNL